MSQHQQGLQDGHDGPEDDAGADGGVGGGQEMTVAGQLDEEEVEGRPRPGLGLRPGGTFVLIPGLEQRPRHHIHHEGLQTEALPGDQDGDEDAKPLVYEVGLHEP